MKFPGICLNATIVEQCLDQITDTETYLHNRSLNLDDKCKYRMLLLTEFLYILSVTETFL